MRIDRLDGIRTAVILMVLLFHRGSLAFGWTGVDRFFVLSGVPLYFAVRDNDRTKRSLTLQGLIDGILLGDVVLCEVR
jgi:peptidoglycan/LPS O-acetylase OafA/YrhL